MDIALRDFEGGWRIDRKIEDALTGQTGQFTGQALLPADGEGLAYHETGILRLGDGPALHAERRYLWREGEDGEIVVLFADGRPFHRFRAQRTTSPLPELRHDCAPDLYLVRYDFAGWPDWQAEWAVTGPRKKYRMTSHFSPLGGPAR